MTDQLTEEIIHSFKVTELKEELKKRDLSTAGRKAELVERLLETLKEEDGSEETGSGDMTEKKEQEQSAEPQNGGEEIQKQKKEETTENASPESAVRGKRKLSQDDDVVGDASKDTIDEAVGSGGEEEKGTTKKAKMTGQDDDNNENENACILVTGFVRPFRLAECRSMFESYGALSSFWMDRFRSLAYVIYENVTDASQALKSVSGIEWPKENHCVLTARYSSAEEAEEAKSAGVAKKPTIPTMPFKEEPAQEMESTEADEKEAIQYLYTKHEPSLPYLPLTEEQVQAKSNGEFVAPSTTTSNASKQQHGRVNVIKRPKGGRRWGRDQNFDRRDGHGGRGRNFRDNSFRGGGRRDNAWEERRTRKYERDGEDFRSLKTGRVGIFSYDHV